MDIFSGSSPEAVTIWAMDTALLDLARTRGGLVTVPEVRRLGILPARLNRLSGSGRLVHVRRGAYALADVWREASEVERYALRTRAVLRTRPAVAASHHAALVLAGLPVWALPPDRIDVVDVAGTARRARGKAGLVVHPRPARLEIVVDDHEDARVALTSALVSLARDAPAAAFATALDQALGAGLTTVDEMRSALDLEDTRTKWVRRAAELLAGADPLSPGPEATRLRILLRDLGFRPRLRVPLASRGRTVLRAELLVGSSIAVVRTAYPDRDRDRLRELGVTVAVVQDADLDHPHRVAAALAEAMRELDGLRLGRACGA